MTDVLWALLSSILFKCWFPFRDVYLHAYLFGLTILILKNTENSHLVYIVYVVTVYFPSASKLNYSKQKVQSVGLIQTIS